MLCLLVGPLGHQQFTSALWLLIARLESSVAILERCLCCKCRFHHIKWDKGKHHLTPTHTREFMWWIIHCIWFSFMAALFVVGVKDLKDWIQSRSGLQLHPLVNWCTYSWALSMLWNYGLCLSMLLPNKLEAQVWTCFITTDSVWPPWCSSHHNLSCMC